MVVVTRIDHVQIAIPKGSEARCRPFFADPLGFTETEKPEALAGRGGAWFRSGTVEIHLGVDASFRPAKKAHVAFRVADLAALADRLSERGYPVAWDDAIPGLRRFFTEDPVGNRIELIED